MKPRPKKNRKMNPTKPTAAPSLREQILADFTTLRIGSRVLESYTYLGLNTVVERDHQQDGINLTTTLDTFGRIQTENWGTTTSTTPVDGYSYGYDNDGNVLYACNSANATFSQLYTYDQFNQVTTFKRGTLATGNQSMATPNTLSFNSESWSSNPLGDSKKITTDGTTQVRYYNSQNGFTELQGSTPVYDNNGNEISNGQGVTFTYDAWNRLVQVANNGTIVASYTYDALGRRIQMTEGGSKTNLYYSTQGQVLEERLVLPGGQGEQVTAQYVWSPVYVNALVLRDDQLNTTPRRLYALQDANWNVTALVGQVATPSGTQWQVVERYAYDPYGQLLIMNSDWTLRQAPGIGCVSNFNWHYLFQGGYYDYAIGLYHFGARDYSRTQQRWLQQDPIRYKAGDSNLYRFVGNNPVKYVDPSGKFIIVTCIVVGCICALVTIGGAAYVEYKANEGTEILHEPPTPESEARLRDVMADVRSGGNGHQGCRVYRHGVCSGGNGSGNYSPRDGSGTVCGECRVRCRQSGSERLSLRCNGVQHGVRCGL